MSGRNETESFGYGSATRTPMDRQGRPDEPQRVYRRDPETGRPVEGLLRWGHLRRETQPSPHWTYRDCEGT